MKQQEVITTLETLEDIWDEYQVYSKDELNMIGDTSLLAIRLQEEYRFIGECMLSVRVITFALRLLANSIAFSVRME